MQVLAAFLSGVFVAQVAHGSPSAREETCPQVVIHDVTPATLEWAYWLGGGAVVGGDSEAGPLAGIGAEATLGVLTYRGFPASGGPWLGRGELRIGPWLAAATRRDGGLIEGGPKLHLGGIYPPSFGTFDLRLGAGYAAFARERAPSLSATLLWGIRGVLARHTTRSACGPRATARDVAEASVLRLFVSYRRALGEEAGSETTVGVELSPTLLFGGAP